MQPSRASAAVVALGLATSLATLTPAGAPAAAPAAKSAAGSAAGWSSAGAQAARPASALARPPRKNPTAVGRGGAVTSVDPYASRIGLRVLRRGGNAVDAAVATAAALGVTEPYSAGIGGGGYLVFYDAERGRVRTLDGRETAPRDMPRDAFIDPETGSPYNFTPELVTSGVSVGTPGTVATWRAALRRWGTLRMERALAPAARLARRGFVVDRTFREQTADNRKRFRAFTSTRRLFLAGGLPRIGSRFTNPDLARTYRRLGERGAGYFYRGRLAREISRAARKPPTTRRTTLPVPPGFLRPVDLRRYHVLAQRPTRVGYRGYDVFGMRPSSSGGITVGEALNILEGYDLSTLDDAAALHLYLEASALAFADRAEYIGDRRYVDVPRRRLLSQRYARERACEIDEARAMPKPTAPGDVRTYDGRCGTPVSTTTAPAEDNENVSTTNLTVADRWGNVVEYTLTIEQTGGSGIVVPGRGFLLNNELTDFSLEFERGDPNRIQPGKRPRSSMSPTIVLRDGKPFLALGSPGGSTIITTVLQMILNRIDRGMTLPQAIADPRAAQRNTETVTAEPEFITAYGPALEAFGHELAPAGDAFTSEAEIGAATAIEFGPGRRLTAVAEPERRGGGSARVLRRLP